MSIPQASTRAQELASQMFSRILLQCGNCGVSNNTVTIYDARGCGSVGSCEQEECKLRAFEIIEAKERVSHRLSLDETLISVIRSDGSLESGFKACTLWFSETHQKLIIKVSKPETFTEKGVFISEVSAFNKDVVIHILPNRFVDSAYLDHLNSIAGREMFKMKLSEIQLS